MRKVTGSFDATGAILTIGVGFVPDYVKVTNIDSANLESIEYDISMLDGTSIGGGIKRSGLQSVSDSKLSAAAGIIAQTDGATAETGNTSKFVKTEGEDYSYMPAAAGKPCPSGFQLAADADVNVSGEACIFEAGFYDGTP